MKKEPPPYGKRQGWIPRKLEVCIALRATQRCLTYKLLNLLSFTYEIKNLPCVRCLYSRSLTIPINDKTGYIKIIIVKQRAIFGGLES